MPTSPALSRTALAAALAAALTACAVHEPRTQVPMDLPAAWAGAPDAGAAAVGPDWWRGFGSPRLEALVQEALAGSGDLRVAAQRVRQADLALQTAGAAQLPGVSLAAGSAVSRSEGAGVGKSTSVSLSVGYEVDLWGRLAAGEQGARAALEASRYDLEAARITLTASVATTYFQWLALRERTGIARQSLETAERVLRVVQARARNGVATPLEVSQQTATVLQQRTALAPLEEQARQTASALALLLGREPVGFEVGGDEGLMTLQAPSVAPGLPSALLARRPDLRAASRRCACAWNCAAACGGRP
ncbi:MAG: TolC family protein, partial [Acidovorax sp.]|uniref:TolC family protein n=1 Tax=Acidovorax sp. TaxID=1872122 RepID=UPI0039E6C0C3